MQKGATRRQASPGIATTRLVLNAKLVSLVLTCASSGRVLQGFLSRCAWCAVADHVLARQAAKEYLTRLGDDNRDLGKIAHSRACEDCDELPNFKRSHTFSCFACH